MYSTRASIRQLNRYMGLESPYYGLPPLKPEKTPPVRKSGRYKFIVTAVAVCGAAVVTVAGMRVATRPENAKQAVVSSVPAVPSSGGVAQSQIPAP